MFGPRAHIDLDAIAANWRMFARCAAPARAAAVVKADAYGLGAAKIGPALAQAGCTRFYVAWPQEGVALREAIGHGPEIAVFHGPTRDTLDAFASAALQPVLNTLEQIDLWAGHGQAALHLDTGMNRLGISERQWTEAARKLAKPALLVSHLACADEFEHAKNRPQLTAFSRASSLWPGTPRSLAATGGVYLGPDFAMEEIRAGIGIYGGGPTPPDGERPKTVLTLTAPILQIRNVSPGQTVGYGATWTADSDRTLATVGLGYADGFLRAASNRGMAVIAGRKCPIVGRVSMDLTVLDVTGVKASVGDDVEFIGPHMPLSEVADAMRTIDYEILTRLGPRIVRIWSGGR
jgi:alanine racemase